MWQGGNLFAAYYLLGNFVLHFWAGFWRLCGGGRLACFWRRVAGGLRRVAACGGLSGGVFSAAACGKKNLRFRQFFAACSSAACVFGGVFGGRSALQLAFSAAQRTKLIRACSVVAAAFSFGNRGRPLGPAKIAFIQQLTSTKNKPSDAQKRHFSSLFRPS